MENMEHFRLLMTRKLFCSPDRITYDPRSPDGGDCDAGAEEPEGVDEV